jgi:hypothetical protein
MIHWVPWGTGTPKIETGLRDERVDNVKGDYVILTL